MTTPHRRRDRHRIAAAAIGLVAAGLLATPAVASAAPPNSTPVGGQPTGTVTPPPAPPKTTAPDAPSPETNPPVQTQECNDTTQSGGEGVTETRHLLGRTGPTLFVLDYETFDIPDKIEVVYQGLVVANTGYVGDDLDEGTGSITVLVPPGVDQSVVVRVTGPAGTDWDYTVNCPI